MLYNSLFDQGEYQYWELLPTCVMPMVFGQILDGFCTISANFGLMLAQFCLVVVQFLTWFYRFGTFFWQFLFAELPRFEFTLPFIHVLTGMPAISVPDHGDQPRNHV